jgi:hypothetical protein
MLSILIRTVGRSPVEKVKIEWVDLVRIGLLRLSLSSRSAAELHHSDPVHVQEGRRLTERKLIGLHVKICVGEVPHFVSYFLSMSISHDQLHEGLHFRLASPITWCEDRPHNELFPHLTGRP